MVVAESSVKAAGTYRVSASERLWIEVVGPAGVVKSSKFAMEAGCESLRKSVAFPLEPETDYWIERDRTSAGYPIMVPVVDLVEIGNGGGSIAWVDDFGKLHVGPQSAGAVPGPAAYGRGGLPRRENLRQGENQSRKQPGGGTETAYDWDPSSDPHSGRA